MARLRRFRAYMHVKRDVKVSIQKVFIYPEEREAADYILAKLGLAKAAGGTGPK